MTYFDENFQPMDHEQMEDFYRIFAPEDPSMLADRYIEFTDFRRIEFLVFKDRLSTALYMHTQLKNTIDRDLSERREAVSKGDHRIEGWEGESDQVAEDIDQLLQTSMQIQAGAAVLTAVAALEALLGHIRASQPTKKQGDGLVSTAKVVTRELGFPVPARDSFLTSILHVARLRNQFAHQLDGGLWNHGPDIVTFDEAVAEDAFMTVGRLAVSLNDHVDNA